MKKIIHIKSEQRDFLLTFLYVKKRISFYDKVIENILFNGKIKKKSTYMAGTNYYSTKNIQIIINRRDYAKKRTNPARNN